MYKWPINSQSLTIVRKKRKIISSEKSSERKEEKFGEKFAKSQISIIGANSRTTTGLVSPSSFLPF